MHFCKLSAPLFPTQRDGLGEHGEDVCEDQEAGRRQRVSGQHGQRARCTRGSRRQPRARTRRQGGHAGHSAQHVGALHCHVPCHVTSPVTSLSHHVTCLFASY